MENGVRGNRAKNEMKIKATEKRREEKERSQKQGERREQTCNTT